MTHKVSVFGVGYLGLAMSAFFAKTETVIGVDSDEGKIRQLSQGSLPIFEPEIGRAHV
jgi:UDPglucose 6-dehydrogenase